MTGPTDRPGGEDGWSDERLDAAFTARSAGIPPMPPDIAEPVLARIARAERPRSRWAALLAAGATLGLVGVLGATSILSQLGSAASNAPGQSDPASSGNRPESGGPPTSVLDVLGPPMTVEAALAVRDGEQGDREIAVEGFLSPLWTYYCSARLHPLNPTDLWCAELAWWVMADPEPLAAGDAPTVAAFNPSFALVDAPEIPVPAAGEVTPVPVVLVGHFNDRRAALCPEERRATCAGTFVVDHVASIDGVGQPVRTRRLAEATPKDLEADVDALVAAASPGSIVVARQIMTLDPLIGIEPVLANDMLIPYIVDRSTLAWVVTTVDPGGDRPVTRTFVLLDGSSWFAEITADGPVAIEREVPEPTASAPPVLRPGDPSAFDSAPTSVLGLPVEGVGWATRQGRIPRARDEYAVRAWYVGPPPVAEDCYRPIYRIAPPCDEARHWLLDDPQQYGTQPGQLRRTPADRPQVLNPLIPIDVPFEVRDTWGPDGPIPTPVVVLGHFADERVDNYGGDAYFVIDALVWTPDGAPAGLDRVVRLTELATEDFRSVEERVQAVSTSVPLVTWTTALAATDAWKMFGRFTPEEFRSGAPVWIVRRLVQDEDDGRQRLALETGFTADGGTRVWLSPPDGAPDLATTFDIRQLDPNTELVRVFDYDDIITGVGAATGMRGLDWVQPRGNATDDLRVARGRSNREVVIRWIAPICPGATWNVRVYEDDSDDGGFYFSIYTMGDCHYDQLERVTRQIVIEFDHPIDIRKIDGPSCCG